MEAVLKKIRDFADNAHGDQLRKYTPDRYIVHPERVMETCRNYDTRLSVLAAALLHDVLEDTEINRNTMFGFLLTVMKESEAEKTISLVEQLTDVYVKKAYPHLNREQRKRKELDRIIRTSRAAQTIKYADILDNTKEITEQDPGFAPRFLRECLEILEKANKGNKNLRNLALDTVQFGLRHVKKTQHTQ
jgi:(p)ppGpp synthase/HD superfamily hydrolase